MSVLLDASSPSLSYHDDPYAHHAWNIIKSYHDELRGAQAPTGRPVFTLPGSTTDSQSSSAPIIRYSKPTEAKPVGILGAGVGGLYTAFILDSLSIPYKIIEARDRVGGRLFTHRFDDPTGAPYNYYDVGAMRFPRIESMRRVFHLIEHCKQVNSGDIQLKAKLRPFYFTGAANNDTLFSYNDITVKQTDVPNPPGNSFKDSDVVRKQEWAPYIAAGARNIIDDVIEPFATRLLKDLNTGGKEGWYYLMKYDKYSTRAYMALEYEPSNELRSKYNLPKGPLPTPVINWCETFDTSTGSYDRALSETVLEAIAFGWQPKGQQRPTQWFLIDGGSYEIADCMKKYILSRRPGVIQYNSRVGSIGLSNDGNFVDVVTNYTQSHSFSHVISTIPLPVLRIIDMSKAKLTPMQSNAIRSLNYGPSIKIGMQFKSAWWTNGKDKDGNLFSIIGGQTYTDRPLRTVVYPSYGNVKDGNTPVLIASYCWTEDAERFAALIENNKSTLIRIVLKELAEIHNVTPGFLNGELLDTFAWSWSSDPYTMGAFAFFGPGKYDDVYKSLTTPAAEGRLHFAGEAISVRHAWVEGALDSAWRAVEEMLWLNPQLRSHLAEFYKQWGKNPEWTATGPELPQPVPQTGRTGPTTPEIPEMEDSLVARHISLTRPDRRWFQQ